MSEPNPFQPPSARIEPAQEQTELAGRGVRLGAAMLDGLLLLVILLPLMFFGGYFAAVMEAARVGEQVSFVYVAIWTLIGFVAFVALQAVPLYQSGQTWAKRWLGIRIVDLAGAKPALGVLLWRRYLPVQLTGAVPFVGGVLVMVDALLIFREDRRCAHDLIAGTRVVRAA